MMEERWTAERGVFCMGGPGAYIVEGKSGAGKNYLLEHYLMKSRLPFDNVWTLSTTEEESGDLDFIERLYDTERWAKPKNIDEIMYLVGVRKEMLAKLKNEFGKQEKEDYILRFPILLIVDDIGGTTNTRSSENNPWYTLFTTARHHGIYVIVLVQYHKQIGPAFIGNTRALITFDYADDALKHFAATAGMSITTNDKKQLQSFLKNRFNFLIWWKNWVSESAIPDFPWRCVKVSFKGPVIINDEEYPQNATQLMKGASCLNRVSPINNNRHNDDLSCDDMYEN